MPKTAPRRFGLGDAMILIIAVTPGLLLIRFGMDLGLFRIDSLGNGNGQPAPIARQFIEFLNLGGGCILAGLVPAVLILGLYQARPSWREAAGGPGLITCIVAALAAIPAIVRLAGLLLILGRSPEPNYAMPFNNTFGYWVGIAGRMILGAWSALALAGRWRPRPTWTDWAGCALGACFVLIHLYAEIYFVIIAPIGTLRRMR